MCLCVQTKDTIPIDRLLSCVLRDPSTEEHLLPASPSEREIAVPVSAPCRHFELQHYISCSVLQPRLFPPPPPKKKTGGELHSVPTGRLRQVRAAPCLDPLQPRAAGQHRRHRFDGQGHAHEAQVHLGLADARYGNNVRNPNRRELLFHCTDSIIAPFSMS